MKKERQRKDPRRRFEEEGPSTSYQQRRKPENHKSPHRSTEISGKISSSMIDLIYLLLLLMQNMKSPQVEPKIML